MILTLCMEKFSYVSTTDTRRKLGLITLQSDETIEDDMRKLLPSDVSLLVSRVPSGQEVSLESLQGMTKHLTAAASLFPRGLCFDGVGYGCTSGTSQIGAQRIASLVREGTETNRVTEPLSALVAVCKFARVKRLAILSPYIAMVSTKLCKVLEEQGVSTTVFGSFAEPNEARVVSIDNASIISAATKLVKDIKVDALFLSCTNLRTLDAVGPLVKVLGIPVFSSNLVLAWHMLGSKNPPWDLL